MPTETCPPQAWAKIVAANEARIAEAGNLEILKAERATAKTTRDGSIESHSEADREIIEQFGGKPPDQAAWSRLCGLSDDVRRHSATFELKDRLKLKKEKHVATLLAVELNLVFVAHSPELLADLMANAGKGGPDSWKDLELKDIMGDAAAFEKLGYTTIGGFLKGRKVGLVEHFKVGDITDEALMDGDIAVYNFLERRRIEKHWPFKTPPPGCQTTIETGDETEPETPPVDPLGIDAIRDVDGTTIRIIGRAQASEEAVKHKFDLKEHGRAVASESKAVENVIKKSAADTRSTSSARGKNGLFVLVMVDGKMRIGEFSPRPQ